MSTRLPVVSFCLILMISLMNPAQSQFGKFHFGIRGGLNLADTNADVNALQELEGGTFSRKMVPRLSVGAFVEYPLTQRLFLQLNVLYSQKGERFEGTFVEDFIGIIDFKVTNTYDYLSIPLLVRYTFLESESKLYLVAGPEFGYLLDSHQKVEADIMVIGLDTTLVDGSLEDDIQPYDWAIHMGAGIEFPVSKLTAFIEGRYGLGLVAINKEGEENLKNNVIYLNLGIRF